MPGVHAVLTAADLPEPMRTRRLPLLLPNPAHRRRRKRSTRWRATKSVMWAQAVAVVIADTRYIAEDAAAAMIVNTTCCRPSPIAAPPPRTARRTRTAICIERRRPFRLAYGDIDAAFADAAHVFEEGLWQHRGGGMAMETRAVLASHDPASRPAHGLVGHADAASRPPARWPICSTAICNRSA